MKGACRMALRAVLERLIRELLDGLGGFIAFFAVVFVNRHSKLPSICIFLFRVFYSAFLQLITLSFRRLQLQKTQLKFQEQPARVVTGF